MYPYLFAPKRIGVRIGEFLKEEIIVQGGNRLEGVVKVEGAKNAVLPILAAAILA